MSKKKLNICIGVGAFGVVLCMTILVGFTKLMHCAEPLFGYEPEYTWLGTILRLPIVLPSIAFLVPNLLFLFLLGFPLFAALSFAQFFAITWLIWTIVEKLKQRRLNKTL